MAKRIPKLDPKVIFKDLNNKITLADFHDKLNEDNPEYIRNHREKFKVESYPRPYCPIYLTWSLNGFGFGELVFFSENGKIKCRNECMSKDRVKEILCLMVDQAEFLE